VLPDVYDRSDPGEEAMGDGTRTRRLLFRGVGSVLAATTVVLGVWVATFRTYYGVNSPLRPDEVLGRTVPYGFRSFVVFITQAERSKLDTLETWAWAAAATTVVYFIITEWMQARWRSTP
jgi:hypothetical protein